MSLGTLTNPPDEIISEYRGHLDAGFHGQPIDYHFEVGASMANAYGDHGIRTITELMAIAIASGLDDLAAEGILVYPGDDVEASIDTFLASEVKDAMETVGDILKRQFRTYLIGVATQSLTDDEADSPVDQPSDRHGLDGGSKP